MAAEIKFAVNHMCAPRMGFEAFFDLANRLGVAGVEIRNDLDGQAILDGTPASTIAKAAKSRNLEIVSINALQRFNEWNPVRAEEARWLIEYAAECGAKALVLVPVNDGTGREDDLRQGNLAISLEALAPMLEEAGLTGLVEPLGFGICSLWLKSEAAHAISALGVTRHFKLVHDTFHHHVAGEQLTFPDVTGLVHISGVDDKEPEINALRDGHRALVGAGDRIGNLAQIRSLTEAGYRGYFSFEPFAPSIHDLTDVAAALGSSMDFIRFGVREIAA